MIRTKRPYANSRAIEVDPIMWTDFKARAKKNHMTVSALINLLISDFLKSDNSVWIKAELK